MYIRKPIYNLYLRPFYTAGKLLETSISYPIESIAEKQYIEFETLFAEALEPFSPLVALGKVSRQIGAGIVECDESDWQEKFKLLALGANFIFIFPSYQPGILWEIKWILDNELIEKCFFIMPRNSNNSKINWSVEWTNISNNLKRIDLHMPKYQPNGMIFKIGRDGKLKRSQLFPKFINVEIIHKILNLSLKVIDIDALEVSKKIILKRIKILFKKL